MSDEKKSRLEYMNDAVNRNMNTSIFGNMSPEEQDQFSSLYEELPEGDNGKRGKRSGRRHDAHSKKKSKRRELDRARRRQAKREGVNLQQAEPDDSRGAD